MSWLLNLYKTYNANSDRVGTIEKKYNGQEFTLLPIAHTTQNAHIEVAVTEGGEFHSANVIPKTDASTLIPTTEKSSSRAGKVIAPYPLHDKLAYVAGDYIKYGGASHFRENFESYITQLGNWAEGRYSVPEIQSIYNYLKNKTLIRDLIDSNILATDSTGKLLSKWIAKSDVEKPEIFSVLAGEQDSAFVRFKVYSPTKVIPLVWRNSVIYDSFIGFYDEQLDDVDLCFVTGKMLPATNRHASKIRNAGDKAKLISANDTAGFTYRGRYKTGPEAASISFEASQKAHNALKWLINRQGITLDNRVFLTWGNEKSSVLQPIADLSSLYLSKKPGVQLKTNTLEDYANEVSKALAGYRSQLTTKANINIMILDSATTGRLAILYYREMHEDVYFEKLQDWHTTCAWLHRYRKNQDGSFVEFFGAPALKDIAFAAYGPRANDKLVKGVMERMLPCILDGRRIPNDIVKSSFHRASNPIAMEKWEWEKTLSIACALINRQEEIEVPLDTETNDRDYLFGRMLAIADVLERNALGSEVGRATNALRYMNAFAKHPERTWKVIQENLQPYQVRLGTKGIYYSKIMDEVASRIQLEDFNNKPLSGKYLLGYYSQRHELYQKKEKSTDLELIDEKGENEK